MQKRKNELILFWRKCNIPDFTLLNRVATFSKILNGMIHHWKRHFFSLYAFVLLLKFYTFGNCKLLKFSLYFINFLQDNVTSILIQCFCSICCRTFLNMYRAISWPVNCMRKTRLVTVGFLFVGLLNELNLRKNDPFRRFATTYSIHKWLRMCVSSLHGNYIWAKIDSHHFQHALCWLVSNLNKELINKLLNIVRIKKKDIDVKFSRRWTLLSEL